MKNELEPEQTPCEQCTYYFDKNSINCAIYPQGKETHYCDDWQQKTLRQKVAMRLKSMAESFSYPKAAAIVICIASTITLGHGIKQNAPPAINAVQNYKQYSLDGSVFLKKAGTAGTTGVAKPELAKAISWLETNNLTQSFEYRDLKANLDYLRNQPDASLIPIVIKESVNKNAATIEGEQKRKLNQSLGALFSLKIAGSAILVVLTILVIKQAPDY